MKISKKRLANKVRKLEVQNYDMRQKIKKMDELLTYIDELTTELNHALPDPEYDAKCEAASAGVEASLERHAVRLGLKKPELTGRDLCRAMLLDIKKPVMCKTPKGFDLIKSFRTDGDKYLFHGEQQGEYSVVTPVNIQGEPLTAREVGL